MPILRLLSLVLIALNLLALAAGQGWLGASEPRGEPERVTNQLNPDRIVIERRLAAQATAPTPARTPVPVEAAPIPVALPPPAPVAEDDPAPEACMVYTGLSADQADALERSTREHDPALRSERAQERAPNGWWVRLPPAGSREAAERKVAELRAQGVTDYYIMHEAGPNQYAVSLGLFKSETAANQHLNFLQGKRVRGAGIAPRTGIVHSVQVHGAATSLEGLASRLARETPSALRGECAP